MPILPPTLVAKLDPLIRRLASSHDGEVIAVVRALERRLRAERFDLNDLAETVGQQAPLSAAKSQTKNPRADDSDWRAMRTFCEKRSNFLSAREKEFIADIKRWRGDLTQKQRGWLVSIYER